MIITFGAIKGGVGKTMMATQVALAIREKRPDARVLLVDADSQKSTSQFFSKRCEWKIDENLVLATASGKDANIQIRLAKQGYDYAIVDCGGRDTETLRSCILCSDFLLVPCVPGATEMWNLERDMDLLYRDALGFHEKLKGMVFLNKVKQFTPSLKMLSEMVDTIKSLSSLAHFPVSILERNAYQNAMLNGLSVYELKKLTPEKGLKYVEKAYAEMTDFLYALFEEISNGKR